MEELPQEKKAETADREPLIEKIYLAALAEHARFKDFPEVEIKSVIKSALVEIENMENSADPKIALEALTPEVAEKITALWDFSGPGTYDNPTKEDRYKNYSWAKNMDRNRLSYTAWLARKIAEVRGGKSPSLGPVEETRRRNISTKELIEQSGPGIIYNGTEVENAVVNSVLERTGIIIPKKNVTVLGDGIKNTSDQVSQFSLPEHLHRTGGEIGLISHAPQLMRIVHMLERFQTLPKDMTVRLFPIATPTLGKENYAILEIKGLLYYIYISGNHNAEKNSYPYTIHGSTKTK